MDKQSREHLSELIVTSLSWGIIALNRSEQVVFVNETACKLLGISEDALLGKAFAAIGVVPHRGWETYDRISRALERGEVEPVAREFWQVGHSHIHILINAQPIRDREGTIIGVVVVIADQTERGILEEKLLHADRLSLVGEFAAEIVHEIGNPLSTIHAAVDGLFQRSETFTEHTSKMLTMIRSKIQELDELLSHILNFSRYRQSEEWSFVDLASLLSEVSFIMGAKMRTANVVYQQHSDGPGWIYGSPTEMRQVLLNLMLNSVKAMTQGGLLTAAVIPSERWVHLILHDTGPEIPASILRRIGEPFFTTKNEGTGLGLTVVKRIIQEHKGTFDLVSSPAGTVCTIQLPAATPGERG